VAFEERGHPRGKKKRAQQSPWGSTSFLGGRQDEGGGSIEAQAKKSPEVEDQDGKGSRDTDCSEVKKKNRR